MKFDKRSLLFLYVLALFAQGCFLKQSSQSNAKGIVVTNPQEKKVRLFWTEKEPQNEDWVFSAQCASDTVNFKKAKLKQADCDPDAKKVTVQKFVAELASLASKYKKFNILDAQKMQEMNQIQKLNNSISYLQQEITSDAVPLNLKKDLELSLKILQAKAAHHAESQSKIQGTSQTQAVSQQAALETAKMLESFDEATGLKASILADLASGLSLSYTTEPSEVVSPEGLVANFVWTAFFNALGPIIVKEAPDYSETDLGIYASERPIELSFTVAFQFAHQNQETVARYPKHVPYVLMGPDTIFFKGEGAVAKGVNRSMTRDFSNGLILGKPYCKIEIPTDRKDNRIEMPLNHYILGTYKTDPARQNNEVGLIFYQQEPKQKYASNMFFVWCGILNQDSLSRLNGDVNIDVLDFFGQGNEKTAEDVFKMKHFKDVFQNIWKDKAKTEVEKK